MRDLVRTAVERLPRSFRVLLRSSLLRIVDLEALSIEADVPRYLGQFAGVLIFFSLAQSVGALFFAASIDPHPSPGTLEGLSWHVEQAMIARMMLVAGLIIVFTWDSTFPDRRDVLVLGPLPVAPGTILAAKVAASAAVLGLALLCLNFALAVAWPLVLTGFPHVLRLWPACMLAMAGATVFLYASALAAQGLAALLLPRALFLRLSALLQLAAFVFFPAAYLLLPSLDTPSAILAPENRGLVVLGPQYWFFALLRQLDGSLDPALRGLALRAWIGLGAALAGATAALLAAYRQTMRRTVEEPDLVPALRGLHAPLPVGDRLRTALLLFSLRTLMRSRQHRVALAFSWALVFGMALVMVRGALLRPTPAPVDNGFLVSTSLMMGVAVIGLRGVFSLPVALRANWMLRVTQQRPAAEYLGSARRILLAAAVLPVWLWAASLSLTYRPWPPAGGHLVVLGLSGAIAVELSLIGFRKVPFTCSYLPGTSNVHLALWGLLSALLLLPVFVSLLERPALHDPPGFLILACTLALTALATRLSNRSRERGAELYYEELPEEPLVTLHLTLDPRSGGRQGTG